MAETCGAPLPQRGQNRGSPTAPATVLHRRNFHLLRSAPIIHRSGAVVPNFGAYLFG